MTTELFVNPTVSHVIYQVRYPNLFFLESRIGELQEEIMRKFPESQLQVHRKVMIAEIETGKSNEKSRESDDLPETRKIWRFISPDGVILNIQSNSLDLSSETHKSYNHPDASPRFREIIEYVLHNFLKIAKVPLFTRIGLRYIDHCPVMRLTDKWFRSYYRTTLPIERFALKDAVSLQTTSVVHRGKYDLRFQETLKRVEGSPSITLDYDGSAKDVETVRTMETTDDLHDLIYSEWQETINDGLRKYMRKAKGKS
jgi:uncharacterized protein (TIGR04255 family)